MEYRQVTLPFGNKEILQPADGHGVTDATAILYEQVAAACQDEPIQVLELGSGSGILSIMLALRFPRFRITGIEIQRELVNLAETNSRNLGLSCSFVEGDLRNYKGLLPLEDFQLIIANPPWIKEGAGLVSPRPDRAISHQEVTCRMKDILACLNWCLDKTGRGWLVYPVERKQDLQREVIGTDLRVLRLIESPEHPACFVAKLGYEKPSDRW